MTIKGAERPAVQDTVDTFTYLKSMILIGHHNYLY